MVKAYMVMSRVQESWYIDGIFSSQDRAHTRKEELLNLGYDATWEVFNVNETAYFKVAPAPVSYVRGRELQI